MKILPLTLFTLLTTPVYTFTHRPPTFTHASTSLQATSMGPLAVECLGIGSCAPHTIITNVDLETVVETTDEWIKTRTGISQRRVLTHKGTPLEEDREGEPSHESLKSLSIGAAKNALDMSGVDPNDIDMVICATSTPDDLFGDATTVAAHLGCEKAFAWDLTAACSGFLFGLVTAGQFLDREKSGVEYALVVGADALSRWVDWGDRNSCILFGDGAGAMVLKSCAEAGTSTYGVLGYSTHSNGFGSKDLSCGFKGDPVHVATPGTGLQLSSGTYNAIAMNGKEVYKFATREVPAVLTEALDAASITADQVDWLLLHQANIRIMEVVAQRMGIPMSKVITNLHNYGNTSAGSIPIALDEAVRDGIVKKGDVIACAGFGAGLSWGAAIIRWGGE